MHHDVYVVHCPYRSHSLPLSRSLLAMVLLFSPSPSQSILSPHLPLDLVRADFGNELPAPTVSRLWGRFPAHPSVGLKSQRPGAQPEGFPRGAPYLFSVMVGPWRKANHGCAHVAVVSAGPNFDETRTRSGRSRSNSVRNLPERPKSGQAWPKSAQFRPKLHALPSIWMPNLVRSEPTARPRPPNSSGRSMQRVRQVTRLSSVVEWPWQTSGPAALPIPTMLETGAAAPPPAPEDSTAVVGRLGGLRLRWASVGDLRQIARLSPSAPICIVGESMV